MAARKPPTPEEIRASVNGTLGYVLEYRTIPEHGRPSKVISRRLAVDETTAANIIIEGMSTAERVVCGLNQKTTSEPFYTRIRSQISSLPVDRPSYDDSIVLFGITVRAVYFGGMHP